MAPGCSSPGNKSRQSDASLSHSITIIISYDIYHENTKAYQSQVVEHSWTQTIGYPFPTFKPAAFRFLCIILLSFATLRLSHSDQTEKRRHQPSIAGLGCFFCPLGFLDLCGLLAKCHTRLNHEQTSVKSVNSYTWQTDTPWAPHEPIWAPVKISQSNSSKQLTISSRQVS